MGSPSCSGEDLASLVDPIVVDSDAGHGSRPSVMAASRT
jgi:isocitrate lyase